MAAPARYDRGDWKAVCDVCGREYKASSLKHRWDGFMVCRDDWEPRHPQDFVRGTADVQAPAWTRPEPSDTFVYPPSWIAIAGIGVAGAAIAGKAYPRGEIPPSTFTP